MHDHHHHHHHHYNHCLDGVSPIDKDRFTLVPRVSHFHPGHHQPVHAAALAIQVHLVITKKSKSQKYKKTIIQKHKN